MHENPEKPDAVDSLEDVDLDWVECVHGDGIRKRVEELLAMPENASLKVIRAAKIAVDEYWVKHADEIGTMLNEPMGSAA